MRNRLCSDGSQANESCTGNYQESAECNPDDCPPGTCLTFQIIIQNIIVLNFISSLLVQES